MNELWRKDLWDNRFNFFGKENPWVDSVVMRYLARRFVEHKVDVHGEDVSVILFCENLSAHLDE